jgi:hypothetical protein
VAACAAIDTSVRAHAVTTVRTKRFTFFNSVLLW